MAVTINGDGTISGVSVGGLPDGVVDSGTLATGIDVTKLADGTITNSELQYINSLSSNAQTQISAAGGAMVYIDTVPASDVATVDFLSSFSATYDVYIVHYCDVVPATDGALLGLRIAQGGTAQSTGQYRQVTTSRRTDGDSAGNGETASTEFDINLNGTSSDSGGHSSGEVTFYNPLNTSTYKTVTWRNALIWSVNDVYVHNIGAGSYWSTTATSGFQFRFSTGNVASGTFRLYGIVNS